MEVAETKPNRYDYDHRRHCRPTPFGEHHREQHTKQRKNRATRQVYTAGNDNYSDTNAEYPVSADQPRHILQVGTREKARIQNRNDCTQYNQEYEYAEFFSHRPRLASA